MNNTLTRTRTRIKNNNNKKTTEETKEDNTSKQDAQYESEQTQTRKHIQRN